MKIQNKKLKNLKNKNEAGITLVALIVTIIILLILAGITIIFALGENGIINKAEDAGEKTQYETAKEIINFKITNVQISKYSEANRMPTLKELADNFCEDDDFEYVLETSRVSSLDKIASENPTSIFTKLKEYPYEFEINDSFQLASINGVKVGTTSNDIATLQSTIESLEARIKQLEENSITKEEANSTYVTTDQMNTAINNKDLKEYTWVELASSQSSSYTSKTVSLDKYKYIVVTVFEVGYGYTCPIYVNTSEFKSKYNSSTSALYSSLSVGYLTSSYYSGGKLYINAVNSGNTNMYGKVYGLY